MAFPSLIYQLLNVNKMLCAMEPSAGNGSPRGVFGPSVLLSSPDNSARKKKKACFSGGGDTLFLLGCIAQRVDPGSEISLLGVIM